MTKKWTGLAGIALVIFAAFYFFKPLGSNYSDSWDDSLSQEDSLQVDDSKKYLYGIDVTGLNIIEGTVEKNQTLGSILSPFSVPYQIIDEIAKKSKEVFDVRHIALNKKFTILTPADSAQAKFFIYEPNPAEYVVFDLDSLEIYRQEKPAEYVTKQVGGTIKNSLYVDMTAQGIGPDLVDLFADLYGWSVDFQRLQKGDKYKVVYEEKLIDGISVGVTEIKLAYFEHMGEPYHAIPFEQNGELNFFDQEGNSLKKAFLRDPLKYSRISSRYNLNRFHPVQKRYKPHLGTDYAAPRGTEIRTVGDGTVVEAGYSRGNGNYVKIKHNGTYTTQYLHMSKIGSGIKKGARVRQGQVIGYVGSTGLATGPHLCFRFWKHGKQVDWLKEKIPPSEPILAENKNAFESIKFEAINLLAGIPISNSDEKLMANESSNTNSGISGE
ncbi:M23 family metallopeptidase [Algoriphagus limi]|uniref:Peptidoglycan DD-metalloendopeptidase family protein n=1 Tax=Algoriphagus limi TaxID=2975273 RepID=A0ABT2GB33_9BACT|nr:peptidoglycan DD-metalloendopeptidase family protein [Algoriphagus limi]MCS5491215.1 peptidoglycan DD-metalloendopeptidase family protein [Algoriphagus limi]